MMTTDGHPRDAKPGGHSAVIDGFSNHYIIHPLSRKLANICVNAKIHPHFISAAGLLAGLGAAVCIYDFRNPISVLAAVGLALVWHVFDGADGQVARRTGKASETGFIVDGIADFLTYFAIYLALCAALYAEGEVYPFVLLPFLMVSHTYHSAIFECEKAFLAGYLKDGLLPVRRETRIASKRPHWVLNWAARSYDQVQETYARFIIAEAGQTVSDSAALSKAVLQTFRYWRLLSANGHTTLIFLFALLQRPEGYFIFQIVFANIYMAVLMIRHRRIRSHFRADPS